MREDKTREERRRKKKREKSEKVNRNVKNKEKKNRWRGREREHKMRKQKKTQGEGIKRNDPFTIVSQLSPETSPPGQDASGELRLFTSGRRLERPAAPPPIMGAAAGLLTGSFSVAAAPGSDLALLLCGAWERDGRLERKWRSYG